MAGANLCVGSGASQLTLPLLVVGLSLAPGLTALVPVVPRDAHRSALAAKSLWLLLKNARKAIQPLGNWYKKEKHQVFIPSSLPPI